MKNEKMEAIVSLAKRRGFIYQGSEIYGGLSGTWDYGPLGVTLKRNIMNLWWRVFVEARDDMYGVDAAILMNQKVWQASGHVDTFVDPLVDCLNCNSRFRVDQIMDEEYFAGYLKGLKDAHARIVQKNQGDLEEYEDVVEYYKKVGASLSSINQLKKDIEKIFLEETAISKVENDVKAARQYLGPFARMALNNMIKCSVCGHQNWGMPRTFNMMLKTNIGPVSDDKSISYLRPETAQGIFTNFKNVVDNFYPDLPFGIAQQGKAFRNEISPRDFVFRSREFEQMEIEYFVHPDKWEESFERLLRDIHEFLEMLELPKESIHELEVPEEDRAHYSKRTVDIEFDFPIGKEELLGLAYRTDFDLGNIGRESGKNVDYTVKGTNERFIPHVIEPSFGVERLLMAVLSSAYREDEINGEKRVFLKLPEHLAPVKYAVSPLLKNKPELVEKAHEVYQMLKKKHGNVMWDDNGNIGKRYRRQDEIGTPYCVVIDFDTLEDNTVTVRDRDTTEQSRVGIHELMTRDV